MSETKTLFILRHAKSLWDEEGISDFDRPLKDRGINDAKVLANVLRDELERIQLVVSSPANRAVHTAIIFCQTTGLPLEAIKLIEELYETTENVVDSIVKSFPNNLNCAMVVGHNPTFTYFANRFLPNPIENLPTAGIVMLQFESPAWSNISKNNLSYSLVDFPKNH